MSGLKALHLLYSGSEKGGAQRVAIDCALHNPNLYTSTVRSGSLIKFLQERSLRSMGFNKLIFHHRFDVIFCSDPRALLFSFFCLRSVLSKKFLILHSDKLIRHKFIITSFCRLFFVRCVCTTKTQLNAFESSLISTSLVRIVDIPTMKNPVKRTQNILYFGRFDKIKNLQEIIEIFTNARKKINTLKLTLVGSGNEILFHNKGVEIIYDWMSRDELEKIMQNSSFIVNATNHEGFSLQIMEGISNGLFPLVKSKGLINNYNLPEECKLNVENILKAIDLNESDWNKFVTNFQKSLYIYLKDTIHIKEYVKFEIQGNSADK